MRDRLVLLGLLRPLGFRVIAGLTAAMVFVTLLPADLIVVLNAGKVEDVGTHRDLVGRGGSYAAMFRQQAAAFGQLAS